MQYRPRHFPSTLGHKSTDSARPTTLVARRLHKFFFFSPPVSRRPPRPRTAHDIQKLEAHLTRPGITRRAPTTEKDPSRRSTTPDDRDVHMSARTSVRGLSAPGAPARVVARSTRSPVVGVVLLVDERREVDVVDLARPADVARSASLADQRPSMSSSCIAWLFRVFRVMPSATEQGRPRVPGSLVPFRADARRRATRPPFAP